MSAVKLGLGIPPLQLSLDAGVIFPLGLARVARGEGLPAALDYPVRIRQA